MTEKETKDLGAGVPTGTPVFYVSSGYLMDKNKKE